jgi:arginine exporter protein ArgO
VTRENLILLGIYGAAIPVAIAFGIVAGFATVGAAVTVWIAAITIKDLVDDHYRRKYDDSKPPKIASGL